MGFCLGDNREQYDAELYVLLQAAQRFGQREATGRHFTVFTDPQAALEGVGMTTLGLGRFWPKPSFDGAVWYGSKAILYVTLRWVLGHADVEGKEMADI